MEEIRIRDVNPGSETLVRRTKNVYKYDAKFQFCDTSQPGSLRLRIKMLSCVYRFERTV
jgi:hypothetical protein